MKMINDSKMGGEYGMNGREENVEQSIEWET
jgi:hypothetical protein